MSTMCHYNREQKQKKKKRSEPLIAVLEEVYKIFSEHLSTVKNS